LERNRRKKEQAQEETKTTTDMQRRNGAAAFDHVHSVNSTSTNAHTLRIEIPTVPKGIGDTLQEGRHQHSATTNRTLQCHFELRCENHPTHAPETINLDVGSSNLCFPQQRFGIKQCGDLSKACLVRSPRNQTDQLRESSRGAMQGYEHSNKSMEEMCYTRGVGFIF
jgi:hypothetical protein